jgi:hypothetical protein
VVYSSVSYSLVNRLAKLVNIDRHELSRISTIAIGHDVRLGHYVDVLRRIDGNWLLSRGGLRSLLLRLTARVELNIIVKISGSLDHHDELTSKNDATSNGEHDNQEEHRGNNEWDKVCWSEVRISGNGVSFSVDLSIESHVLSVASLIERNDLSLVLLVLHLVLPLLVLMDMRPSEEDDNGKNSEEEDNELDELEYPIEADHANIAAGSTTEANIEDDNVDEGIHEHNEGHTVVEDVVEEEGRDQEH